MVDKYAAKAEATRRADGEAWWRWRVCFRKVAYESLSNAERTIPDGQYPYPCPICDCWHRATLKSQDPPPGG